MPMELRKRKPATEPVAAPPSKKKATTPARKKDDRGAADAEKETEESAAPAKASSSKADDKKKDAPAGKKGPASKAKAKAEEEEKAEDKPEEEKTEEEKAEDKAEDKADAAKDTTKADDGAVDAKVAAAKDSLEEAKEDAAAKDAAKDAEAAAVAPADVKEGSKLSLEKFGGEILTNDGDTTTLHKLVEESKKGVVIFTYPKASTPGCTTQVCLFRDAYKSITDAGLSVFGLSTDSPKANTTFKDKKELPYPLLCDSAATLIGALGFKKAPRGTIRGVVVVDKAGTVVVHQAAGPAATLEAAQAVLGKF